MQNLAPDPSRLPSFEDIKPNDDDFTCIFWTNSGRRCKNRVDRTDRNAACVLRLQLLTCCRQDVDQSKAFLQYITLCSCKAAHRKCIDRNWFLVEDSIKQWKGELCSEKETFSKQHNYRNSLFKTEPSSQVVRPQSRNLPAALESADLEPITTRTRSRFRKEQLTGIGDLTSSGFKPYKVSSVASLVQAIERPLLDSEMPRGNVYIFSGPLRQLDPISMVKIGHTTKSVEERMKAWSRCGYKPKVEFQVKDIQHTKRVEALVQTELWQQRRRRQYCHNYPICTTQHVEWFEIEIAIAEAVVSKWATRMKRSDPYDEHGNLKPVWTRDKIEALIEERFVSRKPDISEVTLPASSIFTNVPKEKQIEAAELVLSLAAGLLQLQGSLYQNHGQFDKMQSVRKLLAIVAEPTGTFPAGTDLNIAPVMMATVC